MHDNTSNVLALYSRITAPSPHTLRLKLENYMSSIDELVKAISARHARSLKSTSLVCIGIPKQKDLAGTQSTGSEESEEPYSEGGAPDTALKYSAT